MNDFSKKINKDDIKSCGYDVNSDTAKNLMNEDYSFENNEEKESFIAFTFDFESTMSLNSESLYVISDDGITFISLDDDDLLEDDDFNDYDFNLDYDIKDYDIKDYDIKDFK